MNLKLINKIQSILDEMSPISLEEMNHVKLMRRTDTKFVLDAEQLPSILQQIAPYYNVLKIKDEALQAYNTVYYDTPQFSMYHEHHNKRLNRYKVRQREYISSGDKFLEVKFKNNKGETIKNRRPTVSALDAIEQDDAQFLPQYSPYNEKEISPVLNNHFQRITLVSKTRAERLTIDLNLQFDQPEDHKLNKFYHLAIIEVKRERDNHESDVIRVLQKERIKPSGFSKYCMGLATINDKVKYQLFKNRLRKYQLWELRNNY